LQGSESDDVETVNILSWRLIPEQAPWIEPSHPAQSWIDEQREKTATAAMTLCNYAYAAA
jgi:hypothetical protein